MNACLYDGDVVLVNKLRYGARLPFTPLGFTFEGAPRYIDLRLPYCRLPGLSEIARGDAVAFNFSNGGDLPIDRQEQFVKRCMAIPGDSIVITKGEIKVNRVWQLVKTAVKGPIENNNVFQPNIFPHHPALKWNKDNFGPLYIPCKGDSLLLNNDFMIKYERLFSQYEGADLILTGQSYLVNGKHNKYYHVQKNYYFMIGDNRSNSVDSRVFGLIPEDVIIGKVSMVLYSKKKEGRNFMSLN
jgi:signal peptidase I